jgi:hypothetical protein
MATTSTHCEWAALHKILWTGEACSVDVDSSHLQAQDNVHTVRELRRQIRFSVSVWAGTVGDTSGSPVCYLTDSSRIENFN